MGKPAATGQEDEKDPKRAHVVLSQGCEVVGLGYSKLSRAAATETDKGRCSDNLNRVPRVGDRDGRLGSPNWVIWVNCREQQGLGYSGRVGQVTNMEHKPGSASRMQTWNITRLSQKIRLHQTQGQKTERSKRCCSKLETSSMVVPRGYYQDTKAQIIEDASKGVGREEGGGTTGLLV
jgi:hypothetical protein